MNSRGLFWKLASMAAASAMLAIVSLPASAAGKVTVFAAASLKNALDAVSEAWKAETGNEAVISYAASSALARQIHEGAPADIFISADMDWMKSLSEAKLIKGGSVVKLLGNQIVLVAPKDSTAEATIEKGFDLAGLVGDGKLAIGDVKAVPAGKYGKAALESLGVWASVESKVAMAENVRAALKLVSTGEAALGIVYATDAHAEPDVKVLGVFPAGSHPEIVYPAGVVAESTSGEASSFLTYMQGEKAREIFIGEGFTILLPAATN